MAAAGILARSGSGEGKPFRPENERRADGGQRER
jgi:hypothetical protein